MPKHVLCTLDLAFGLAHTTTLVGSGLSDDTLVARLLGYYTQVSVVRNNPHSCVCGIDFSLPIKGLAYPLEMIEEEFPSILKPLSILPITNCCQFISYNLCLPIPATNKPFALRHQI